MGEGKNRASVIVDDPAKENLLVFQKQEKLNTRGYAVEFPNGRPRSLKSRLSKTVVSRS